MLPCSCNGTHKPCMSDHTLRESVLNRGDICQRSGPWTLCCKLSRWIPQWGACSGTEWPNPPAWWPPLPPLGRGLESPRSIPFLATRISFACLPQEPMLSMLFIQIKVNGLKLSSWEHGSLTDGTPAHVWFCRTGCRCHMCNQEKNSASPQSGFELCYKRSRTFHRRGRDNSLGLLAEGHFHTRSQGQGRAQKVMMALENMYFHLVAKYVELNNIHSATTHKTLWYLLLWHARAWLVLQCFWQMSQVWPS